MRYERLNDYYVLDNITGEKLDQTKIIERLNDYEGEDDN